MSPLFIAIALALLVAQCALPRRLAFVPLLIAVCHLGNVAVLPSLTVVRLLVLVGLVQAWSAGKLDLSFRHPLDRLLLVWAGWDVLSSFGHVADESYNPLTVNVSLVVDYLGTYLYARAYLRDQADFIRFCRCLAVVLIPLALCLLVEKTTGQNTYAALGAPHEHAWVRKGKIRAAGPFGNAILAGTIGGVCFPLMVMLARKDRRLAFVALTACVLIVFCSASSGPYMSLLGGLTALALWRWRQHLGRLRITIVVALVALDLVMKDPVWYLMARIDLAGGSTSFHRAELITQALNHVNEWWLAGTDYTRHWLPYGIQWSKNHVDITNHYIKMGVLGGLPLMLAFITILYKAFQLLGRKMQAMRRTGDPTEFILWCFGASFCAHAFTFMAVSYFDQSYVLFCLLLGVVPRLCATDKRSEAVHNAAADVGGHFVPENEQKAREAHGEGVQHRSANWARTTASFIFKMKFQA